MKFTRQLKHFLSIGFLLLLLVLKTSAQYKGGANDGTASKLSVTAQNMLPNIYKGGYNDGAVSAQIAGRNPLPNIYKGAANDGSAAFSASFLNELPNIYFGADGDGSAQSLTAENNPLNNIYNGGNDDGYATVTIYNDNNSINIYTGGDGDGFAAAFTGMNNPLSNIYNGGDNDGYASIIVTGQNAMASMVPVVSLSGEWSGDDILLNWKANSELSVRSYELERSVGDGSRFSRIGSAARSAKFNRKGYAWTDRDTRETTIFYYRVKMILADGRSAYSGIVKLDRNVKAVIYTIYPNPGKGRFNIAINGAADINAYSYRVMATDGRLIKEGKITNALTQFDISRNAAGVYYVQLVKAQQLINTYKIILQH